MWNLPRAGIEPVSPALAGRFSTTVPPEKSWFFNLNFTEGEKWGSRRRANLSKVKQVSGKARITAKAASPRKAGALSTLPHQFLQALRESPNYKPLQWPTKGSSWDHGIREEIPCSILGWSYEIVPPYQLHAWKILSNSGGGTSTVFVLVLSPKKLILLLLTPYSLSKHVHQMFEEWSWIVLTPQCDSMKP